MHAGGGKGTGHQPDDQGRRPDGNTDHGKTQPHGKRIDAGGHGQQYHGHALGGILVVVFFLLTLKRRSEHALGHERQQEKGDPVVVGLDAASDRQPGTPANNRHHGLKKAEVPSQPKRLPRADGF